MTNEFRPEIYYSIVNIVDFLALTETSRETRSALYKILDDLLWIEAENNDEDISDTFDAIADANDVGGVKTWQEMVFEFAKLHESGERK